MTSCRRFQAIQPTNALVRFKRSRTHMPSNPVIRIIVTTNGFISHGAVTVFPGPVAPPSHCVPVHLLPCPIAPMSICSSVSLHPRPIVPQSLTLTLTLSLTLDPFLLCPRPYNGDTMGLGHTGTGGEGGGTTGGSLKHNILVGSDRAGSSSKMYGPGSLEL